MAMCEIRDLKRARSAKLIAFDVINHAFRGMNKVSDIDGVVMSVSQHTLHRQNRNPKFRGEYFLFWEFKTCGSVVLQSQLMLFKGLAFHLREMMTCLVIEHLDHDGSDDVIDLRKLKAIQVMRGTPEGGLRQSRFHPCWLSELEHICNQWDLWAEGYRDENIFRDVFAYLGEST